MPEPDKNPDQQSEIFTAEAAQKLVDAALAKQVKATQAAIEKAVKAALDAANKPREEAAQQEPLPLEPSDKGKGESLEAQIAKLNAQLQAQMKKTEKLEKDYAAEKTGREEATRKQEETERSAAINRLLIENKISNLDLAMPAVEKKVFRGEDGQLYFRTDEGEVPLEDGVKAFVEANPELQPTRIAGGAGSAKPGRPAGSKELGLEEIKPGMSEDDKARVRQQIAAVL